MNNPYLALLKAEKGPHAPVPKVTKDTYGTFGTTPSSHISESGHAMAYDHGHEKQSHAQPTKPTKAPFDTFGTALNRHVATENGMGTTSSEAETPPFTPAAQDPFGTFDTAPGSPFQQEDAARSSECLFTEAESQAEERGRFEGRCDILVWHQALSRLEADALVRLYGRNRDVAESKLLRMEAFYGLARCPRCVHSRQPGDTLHCVNPERSDLEPSYGVLRFIPADGGASCPVWLKKTD